MTDQEDTSIAAISKGHHELVNVVTCMAEKYTFRVCEVTMSSKELSMVANMQPCDMYSHAYKH